MDLPNKPPSSKLEKAINDSVPPKEPVSIKYMFLSVLGLLIFCLSILTFKIIYPQENQTPDPSSNSQESMDAQTSQSDSTLLMLQAPTAQASGVELFEFRQQRFTAFVFDLAEHQIQFSLGPKNSFHSIHALKKKLEKEGQSLEFATNAGIFRKDGRPEGLFVSESKTLSPLNLKKGKGNFYLQPNGVFLVNQEGSVQIVSSEEFQEQAIQAKFATQSGPLLMQTGEIHPAIREGSKNLRLRNGVGIISPTQAVFIISEKPVNFYDFTHAFHQHFGCQDILYLDGVISEMYLSTLQQTSTKEPFSGIISVSQSLHLEDESRGVQ